MHLIDCVCSVAHHAASALQTPTVLNVAFWQCTPVQETSGSIVPHIHTFIDSWVYSSIHPSIYEFIHSRIHPFIHSSIQAFIHFMFWLRRCLVLVFFLGGGGARPPLRQVLCKAPEGLPEDTSEPLKELIAALLQKEADRRPSVHDILRRPFVQVILEHSQTHVEGVWCWTASASTTRPPLLCLLHLSKLFLLLPSPPPPPAPPPLSPVSTLPTLKSLRSFLATDVCRSTSASCCRTPLS